MPATIEQAPGSVLLLGNHLPSLAAARSLTAAGYRVIAGDGGEVSTVRHSRDCAEIWDHPRISREGEFLAALLDFLVRRPDVGHILPLQERHVAFLARDGAAA